MKEEPAPVVGVVARLMRPAHEPIPPGAVVEIDHRRPGMEHSAEPAPHGYDLFAGLSNSGSGLPADFDDVAVYITLWGVTGPGGGVLTMDSSFWLPANVWLWCSDPTFYPPWDGPHEFHVATGVDFANGGPLPTAFSLRQNYPNPFNPTTEVHFDVPTRSHVRIEIYNVLGHRVETLVNEEMGAGSYVRMWDGTNSRGSAVSSGVYLYKMTAGDFTESKKMIMLK